MSNLFKEIKKNGLFTMILHGIRTVLENELDVHPILIATDDAVKGEYIRRKHTEFPYAHLEINEVMGVRDQSSNRTMQRLGVTVGTDSATAATTRKAYLFPATIGVGLKYAHSDPEEYFAMAETLAVLSVLGGITFKMFFGETFNILVRLEIPDSTSIPLSARENTETPGGSEIECAIIVHTFLGFFRDVAAVNSDRPIVDFEIRDIQIGTGEL